MKELKRISRSVLQDEVGEIEVVIKSDGRKFRNGKFSGAFSYSSQHADMMPMEETFSITVNGDRAVNDLFEDEIQPALRKMGYSGNFRF